MSSHFGFRPLRKNEYMSSKAGRKIAVLTFTMARRKFNYNTNNPIHIYARSNNAEWFIPDMDQTWAVFNSFLNYVIHSYNLKVHAFVLMSNHYHMLSTTPDHNLPLIMNRLHTEISFAINDISHRENHVFGSRYKACEIKNYGYLCNVIKYIYNNPVRANICEKAVEYPYSTLSGLYGNSRLIIPVDRTFDSIAYGCTDFDYLRSVDQIDNSFDTEQLTKNLLRRKLL